MGPTPYQYLPPWARVTIERLDSYTEPVRPDEIPPGTLRLIRLAREGRPVRRPSGGNVTELARVLGVSRSTPHRRIQKLALGRRNSRWMGA
ncbi:helix-turn-helix domain-containing protein [Acidovorax sp. SDU_ACID1]|uniref:helix-turn-helix domain-containing protein n=1 Tax=Acidovorax sp. SDU_ACID1 TaxID=3136632 RepID=UPI0038731660